MVGLIKNYDYSQIVDNSQFKEKENISTGHMVGLIKNYDYSQEKDNSQFEEKENINTDLNVSGLIISGIGGYVEGMEQKKGVKNNNFFSKFVKLKIINLISFTLSGIKIYDGYKKDGEKIGDNTKLNACKEICSQIGAAAGAVAGAKLGAIAGPGGSITLAVIFAVSFSVVGNEAGKEGGKKLIEKGKNKKEDEKNKTINTSSPLHYSGNQDNKNP